ncbi:Ger(x)C family spore germination protein [Sporosarcina sp. ACRSM]|uniref:Ger(x)C family spore germination protein n=1 Tax=Sporosarcina sp. ACRSM TaxID=2918216 RepID=UPI001EF4A7AC|nr:Ger(x)C family spore germination protein [Sporosarcina sp. ACRSM]MCG7337017.1 Ger(x)C family spore germination protein [Sporosarcina sp. ACRSM]
MNKKLIAMLILLMPILTSCWDVNEPERMLYIHAIGVDFEDGQYKVYSQIIDFSNTAKSDQPVTKAIQSEVGFATGETMDEAFFELYHSIDQRVFWGHFSYLVLSEEAMKNGRVNSIVDSFIRYRETRYQIWVYSTKDPVKDVLLVTPIINKAITLSKLGDPRNSFKQESFIEPLNFRKLIIALNEPSYEARIPYVSVTENWETIEGPNTSATLTGVGVITPTQFKGFITKEKVNGLQWMTNATKRGEVTVNLKSGEQHYLTVIIDKLKVKVKPIVENDNVTFDIDVRVDVTVSDIEGKITPNEIRKETVKQIKNEIETTYEEGLKHDVDIYRLSEQLYRKDVKTWKRIQKDGKVELTKDSIHNLNVKVEKIESSRKSLRETIEK